MKMTAYMTSRLRSQSAKVEHAIWFALALALMFPTLLSAQHVERKKVAVVLSGGGAKGVAHIGVLRVLERAGVPVDIVTGTSMGSIVGGLYAIGNDAETLDSIVRRQDWNFLLSDREDLSRQSLREREKQNTYVITKSFDFGHKGAATGGGFIQGHNLDVLFNNLTNRYNDSIDFNQLPIPFACVATNIIDNSEYVFHSGYVSRAMRASMAIPGVFSPVRQGDMVLVDGGLRNNYPVDIAREMGADFVIGVTLQGEPKTAADIRTTGTVIGQIVDVNCKNKYEDNLRITDIHIPVNTKGYSTASFNAEAIDSLIHRGEEAAMLHWDEFVALRKSLGIDPPARHTRILAPRLSLPNNSQHKIRILRFHNMTHTDEQFIRSKFKLREGDVIDDNRAELIATSIRKDLFYQTATYSFSHLEPESDGEIVTFIAGECKTTDVSLGVRFDNEEMVALQMNADFPLRSRLPLDLDATLRLGKRTKARVDLSFHPRSFLRPTLSYIFRHNDIDCYEKGSKTFNTTYNHHTLDFSPFNFDVRNFNFSIGALYDHYHYHDLLVSHVRQLNLDTLKNDRLFSYQARVNFNSENSWQFPTRGARFFAWFAYYTDNLYSLNDHAGLCEVAAMWRINIPVTRRLSLQPLLYGRSLIGDDVPLGLYNVIGGEWFGHYAEHQLPFPGVGYIEFLQDKFAAAQLQAQYYLTTNNIIRLRAAAAQEGNEFKDLLHGRMLLGASLSYYYDTLFGPVGASVGYSNKSKDFYIFVNLGYRF